MNDSPFSHVQQASPEKANVEEFEMIIVPNDEDEINEDLNEVEVEIEDLPVQQALTLLHYPSSPEDHLSMRFGTMLRRFHWDETWMGLVPSRIGYNRAIDLAVSAYLEPNILASVTHSSTNTDSTRLYVEAIGSVQTMMNSASFWTSEEAQMAVGILSAYESYKGASLDYMFAHRRGLITLLSRSKEATEAVRAMVYDETAGAYVFDIAQGTKSPFDKQFWWDIDPTMSQAPTRAMFSLRKLAYRTSIRLPRLILMVRRLREGLTDLRAVGDVVSLAQELYSEKDEASESDLLHCVVVATPKQKEIVTVGLRFESFAEFEAAVYYWQIKIFLNRLCAQVQKLFPWPKKFNLDAIDTENCRLAKNLLMSWETTFGEGSFGTRQGGAGAIMYSIALTAVWAVLNDVEDFNGQLSGQLREKVLKRFQILTTRGVSKISAEQMDEMADLYAGGPIQGLIPALLSKRSG